MTTFNRRRQIKAAFAQTRGETLPVVVLAVLFILGLAARYFGWLS